MIATVAFVLGFVVVGLTVVLVALNSGKGKGVSPDGRPRREPVLAATLITLVAAVVGLGATIAVGIGNASARQNNGPGGVVLSDAQQRGRELFARNCATCHTLVGANAVGKVGPNLDQLRPPKVLILNAIDVGRANGRGQMPAQLLTGRDATDVADFVAAVAGR